MHESVGFRALPTAVLLLVVVVAAIVLLGILVRRLLRKR